MTSVHLSDVITFKKGKKPKRLLEHAQAGALPYILIESFKGQPSAFTDDLSCPVVIRSDTLLVCDGARTGLSCSGLHGYIGSTLATLKPDEARLEPAYLFYFVGSKYHLLNSRTRGAAIPHLDKDLLMGLKLPLPSLAEQRRIVDILSRAEGIVKLRREAEKKAAELIPALFLDMFGDPAMNPKGWSRRKLDEMLYSIDSGKSPTCHDRPKLINEWGVLRLSALTNCDYKEDKHKTLPIEIRPDQDVEIRAGDVLFTRKNTYELVGACVYVWKTQGRMLLPDLIFRLNIADLKQLHPVYLWGLLTMASKREQIRKLASGSAGSMPNIAKSRLRTLEVEMPPYEKQYYFAGAVEQIRAIQSQQSAATATAKATFDALLAQTFTGLPPI